MAEYIEREATIKLLKSLGGRDYRREKGTIADAIKMLSHPAYTPAADVVEVVRCGQCRHEGTADCPMSGTDGKVSASDFCSYGERRTDHAERTHD